MKMIQVWIKIEQVTHNIPSSFWENIIHQMIKIPTTCIIAQLSP